MVDWGTAETRRPDARLSNDYQLEAAFKTVSEAMALGVVLAGRLFLGEAVRLRGGE